ncbi:MAG TPA: tocopherol cyclase family protein [Thermotogota bacterium]|nr:tocopherol cyclase family protein [Thermotogota bacterium]
MYSISRLFNPEIFQGKYKSKNYFEGWYYKIVSKDEKNSFAFIPGVAYDKKRNGHAFIQLIDSLNYRTEYFKFPISEFHYSEKVVDIMIGKNKFTRDKIDINLSDQDYPVIGALEFDDIVPFPKTFSRPGIMGPFSFAPFMECYHGVVNIHQKINGSLMINEKEIDFSDGYGYIEKDWGKSFPKWWVWLQSNHFKKKDVSLMFSIAKIPWLGRHFTGFLSFLKIKDELHLFATYTGAKVKCLEYNDGTIEIAVADKKHALFISGKYDESGVLKAPKNGLMERKISESISSTVKVTLKNKKGEILFEDDGKNAGLEVVGKHL